jgi:hypothetical protein
LLPLLRPQFAYIVAWFWFDVKAEPEAALE